MSGEFLSPPDSGIEKGQFQEQKELSPEIQKIFESLIEQGRLLIMVDLDGTKLLADLVEEKRK